MTHDFLDKVYDDLLNKIYSEHNLVNVNELEKTKEKLLSDVQYLPYFIRIYFKDEYNRIVFQNNELYSEVKDNSESSIKDKSIEFIDWIDNHKEYEILLNKNELKHLNKKIMEAEAELEYIRKNFS